MSTAAEVRTADLETNATGAAEIEKTIRGSKPLTEGPQPTGVLIGLWAFVVIPFLALVAAIPVAWGGWLSGTDIAIFLVLYCVAGLGITVGFHRYMTHGSFKAKRWLRVALAVAGSFAVEGSPTQWVADHRRHHAFSDNEGDPHSPWRFGATLWGLTKGLFHAPVGRRRAGHLVLAGRADRVLLGRSGPRRPAAPRHVVHQLDLPRVRRAPV